MLRYTPFMEELNIETDVEPARTLQHPGDTLSCCRDCAQYDSALHDGRKKWILVFAASVP